MGTVEREWDWGLEIREQELGVGEFKNQRLNSRVYASELHVS